MLLQMAGAAEASKLMFNMSSLWWNWHINDRVKFAGKVLREFSHPGPLNSIKNPMLDWLTLQPIKNEWSAVQSAHKELLWICLWFKRQSAMHAFLINSLCCINAWHVCTHMCNAIIFACNCAVASCTQFVKVMMASSSAATATTATANNNKTNDEWMTSLQWMSHACLSLFCLVTSTTLSSGCIHPDEHFQSGQELWWCNDNDNCNCSCVWEFQSQFAMQSTCPPMLMTWMPTKSCSWSSKGFTMITGDNDSHYSSSLSGHETWITPRMFISLLSMATIDVVTWKLTTTTNSSNGNEHWFSFLLLKSPPNVWVLSLLSSWTTMSMLNRPFASITASASQCLHHRFLYWCCSVPDIVN